MAQCNLYRLSRRFVSPVIVTLFGLMITAFQWSPPASAQSGSEPKRGANKGVIDAELTSAIAAAPKASDWPNSNYARLLDIANITVQPDGTVYAKYRLTYKLFNSRDRDQLAEVNLPYNSSYETIHVISARTVRKDGTVVPVKSDDIRESSPYSEFLMYDDAHSMSFSMPAIEDDCVIDYTWEQVTHPMVMPGQFTQFWGFSGFEPVDTCRIVLHIPADKHIKYKTYNDDTLKPVIVTSVDSKTTTYTWERDNIKPVPNEPSMPHVEEVTSWLEISSLDSWQDIAHRFWDLQHPQTKSNKEIKSTVDQLIKGKATEADKARAIYEWVATRTRYVGLEFGISAYKPHSASEVHDKQYGDCKDKATLLITMLGVAGIKAHPVFLHAEQRRDVDAGLPTVTAFDHCIALAQVNGKDVWLDATAETCPYGDIPMGDRGVRALVVKDGQGEFETIPMYTSEENGTEVESHVHVSPDAAALIDMVITLRGEMAQEIRAAVQARTPDQCREMAQKMAQEFSTGATLQSFLLPDAAQTDGPYVLKLKLAAPCFAKKIGRLMIMPLEVGSGSRRQQNPYVQETRVWPIVEEVPSITRSETVIDLPEGFSVEATPDEAHAAGPIQEYNRSLAQAKDGRSVTTVSTLKSVPGRVPADQYAKVRAYYNEVLKTADDWVVLRKNQ